MTTQRTWFLIAAAVTLSSAATLIVERVRAAGIPEEGTLTYTGHLENPDGTPVSGDKNIALQVFNAEAGGDEVCEVPSAAVKITSGRFQVPLPDQCTQAVKDNPNLWVNVEVGGAAIGMTKLGAVPYAVEAQTAQVAHAAAGELQTTLDDLTAAVPKITEWESEASPPIVWSNGTAAPVTNLEYVWRRVGDSVEVRLRATFSSAVSSIIFGAPPGLARDATKGGGGSVGGGRIWIDSSSTVAMLDCFPASYGGIACIGAGASPPYVGAAWPSGVYSVEIQYTIPIDGWTTNTP